MVQATLLYNPYFAMLHKVLLSSKKHFLLKSMVGFQFNFRIFYFRISLDLLAVRDFIFLTLYIIKTENI